MVGMRTLAGLAGEHGSFGDRCNSARPDTAVASTGRLGVTGIHRALARLTHAPMVYEKRVAFPPPVRVLRERSPYLAFCSRRIAATGCSTT